VSVMKAFERYALVFVRVYLGGFNLISGLNYFFEFWPQPVPHDPTGAAYMSVTLHLGLFQMAKVLEVLGGTSLLFGISVPFGLVLLFPVTMTVFVMNVFFSDLIHVRISGARNFCFHLILLAAYARYYLPLLALRAPVRPIWRPGGAEPSLSQPRSREGMVHNG
jgi:putative oxidoreductase